MSNFKAGTEHSMDIPISNAERSLGNLFDHYSIEQRPKKLYFRMFTASTAHRKEIPIFNVKTRLANMP